jgi:hypothetical protein
VKTDGGQRIAGSFYTMAVHVGHVNMDDHGKCWRNSGENWLRKDLELNVKIEARTF